MELDTSWEREAQYTAGRKTRRNRVLKRLAAATIKLEAMAAARDKGSARQAINGAGGSGRALYRSNFGLSRRGYGGRKDDGKSFEFDVAAGILTSSEPMRSPGIEWGRC